MALTLRAPGKVLALARASIVQPTSPARWLVGLRWAALLGMTVTTVAAQRLVPAMLAAPMINVLAILAVANVGWTFLVFRERGGRPSSVTPQLILDVVALTAILWFSGGLTNPFASFLVFQIVLAGLLAPPWTMVLVTAMSVAAVGLLAQAEPLPFSTPAEGMATERLGQLVALVALSAFTGFFVFVYQQRLEAFRQQVARNDRLAALGRTLGAIAHELNTPLGTILLAAREVSLLGAEVGNVEVERLANTMVEEATRASDVIALLRGYVRPDARHEVLDVCAFVPSYVERELDRLRFSGERAFRVAPEARAPVIRAALCQVLTNVVRNAVEAMERSPVRRLELDVEAARGQVTITLRDTGPGIHPSLLSTLGEPFRTTKQDAGGTGLGLYVSALLAERMGGSMALESNPGQGTRVTLTLPLQGGDNAAGT